MRLYKEWRDLAESQTKETVDNFWTEYSDAEIKIYQDILANKKTHFEGVISELAEQYDVRPVIFMGFIDGIQTSIEKELDLDKLQPDSNISMDIDFEKLFFNMLKADAGHLYSLEEWDDVLDLEKKKEIATAYRRSRTIVKDKKIGRNEPCPCGSGKKYKHCCGR